MTLDAILNFHENYGVSIYTSLFIIIGYISIRRYTKPRIEESIEHSRLSDDSLRTASNSANIILIVISVALISIVWGLDFHGLLVLSTGILTITGVALFASWSILSNITAFFILLVHQSFRRGNFVRIIDIDNYIEGYVSEINLFSTKLITVDREIIIYPNNLMISRPTIINPRSRLSAIGKTYEISVENKAPITE
ncbi:MAG: small-conductance mechanosensitive channel [Gammaproteobacteria bacterium]|jgi:small-conductance mechanosensitive channel